MWYALDAETSVIYTFELDGKVETANPTSSHNILLGSNVTFSSAIEVSDLDIEYDTIWQVSHDGISYTDIPSKAKASGYQDLTFTPSANDENANSSQ